MSLVAAGPKGPAWADEYRYPLGPANLACEPTEIRLGQRGRDRMLVVDRSTTLRHHSTVRDLAQWIQPGDVLVLNNSKRIPGVLKLRTLSGAQVELRFTQLFSDFEGEGRIYPTHPVQLGSPLATADGSTLTITKPPRPPHGLFGVAAANGDSLTRLLKTQGLPITSLFYRGFFSIDNYNPVYSTAEGSVESPMAGLHFSATDLENLSHHGVEIAYVTLHPVGSWLPVVNSHGEAPPVCQEPYSIPEETARKIAAARAANRSVIACGTTVVRALESAALPDRTVASQTQRAELFISPGYRFQVVDHYFTNFHPSSSSLILLDAAFCDKELLLNAYHDAAEGGYLFFEFGDAVLYL